MHCLENEEEGAAAAGAQTDTHSNPWEERKGEREEGKSVDVYLGGGERGEERRCFLM